MNYGHIAQALEFYGNHKYVYFPDAPWLVSKEAAYATKPKEAREIRLSDDVFGVPSARQHLVASGEQSFLQMLFDGRSIKRGACVTPCYRSEERPNGWSLPYFMKVELIRADDPSVGNLIQMIGHAMEFFEQYVRTKVIQTSDTSFDIYEQSLPIELGSYGIRHVAHPDGKSKDISWIYGTGCAEPRLSMAIKSQTSGF